MSQVITRRHLIDDADLAHAINIAKSLNTLCAIDRSAIATLLDVRVSCSKHLATTTRVVAQQLTSESNMGGPYVISALSVINALVHEHLAIAYSGAEFVVAVRNSHPDAVDVLWSDEWGGVAPQTEAHVPRGWGRYER